jgi:ubiquitin C-terminal hydrolase
VAFKEEPFYDLAVPLAKSIEEAIEKFTATALFDERNLPICDFCKQATGHSSKSDLIELPQVLCLQVLRHKDLIFFLWRFFFSF